MAAFYFYLSPFFNIKRPLPSFFILLIFSLVVSARFSGPIYWVLAILFGFLFFLFLGVKNLIFVNRQPLYYLFNNLLLMASFIFFFNSDKSQWFFIKYIMVFLIAFILFKEFLAISSPRLIGEQRINLVAFSFSFLILQFVWAIGLLPFSSLNSASLVLLIILILQDFIIHHLAGTINRRVVLRNATIFLVLNLVVFAASKWSP